MRRGRHLRRNGVTRRNITADQDDSHDPRLADKVPFIVEFAVDEMHLAEVGLCRIARDS